MSKLPAEHIKDTLVTLGYSFTGSGDWRLWIGKQPANPDRVITLYDSVGRTPNPRWLLDYPAVQIRVRGGQSDYAEAGKQIKKVKSLLLGRDSYTASNGDRIVAINALGDISFMGWDSTDRPEFVLNLALIVEPAETTDDQRDPL